MKKNLVLVFLGLSCVQVCAQKDPGLEFLEKLFGPAIKEQPGTPEQVSPEQVSPEQVSPEQASPEQISPGKKSADAEKKDGSKKKSFAKKVDMGKLESLLETIGSINTAANEKYFDSAFRDELLIVHIKGKEARPKWFNGLSSSIRELIRHRASRFYSEIFGTEKHHPLFNSLVKILSDATKLDERISKLIKNFKEEVDSKRKILEAKLGKKLPTYEDVINEIYLQKMLPVSERAVQDFDASLMIEKIDLQNYLREFYKQILPETTDKLKTFIKENKGEVNKKIAEHEKASEKTGRGDASETPMPRYGRDEDYPWSQGPDRGRRGEESSDSQPSSSSGTEGKESAKAEEPKKEPEKDPSYSRNQEQQEKEKEKLAKTDLISLMKRVPGLLSQICGPASMQTSIVDKTLETQLKNSSEACLTLKNIIDQIEKRKNTTEAQEDMKLNEWKPTEQEYLASIKQYLPAIIKLGKYQPIEKVGNELRTSQNSLRNICKLASTYKLEEIVKRTESNILNEIKNVSDSELKELVGLVGKNESIFGKYNKQTDTFENMVDIAIKDIDPDSILVRIKVSLQKCWQLFSAAANQPFKTVLNAKNLDIKKVDIRKTRLVLRAIFNFVRGKYSKYLDAFAKEHLDKFSKEYLEVESIKERYEALEKEVNEYLKLRREDDIKANRQPENRTAEKLFRLIVKLNENLHPTISPDMQRAFFFGDTQKAVRNRAIIGINLFNHNHNLLEEIHNIEPSLRKVLPKELKLPSIPKQKIEILDAIRGEVISDQATPQEILHNLYLLDVINGTINRFLELSLKQQQERDKIEIARAKRENRAPKITATVNTGYRTNEPLMIIYKFNNKTHKAKFDAHSFAVLNPVTDALVK